MTTGFTFKGYHSIRDYGVTALTVNRPILPTAKQYRVSPPGRDGSVDFSSANQNRRLHYEDRIIEVELSIKDRTLQALQKKLSQVSAWLTGAGELVFDDSPGVYWEAQVYDGISYAPQISGKLAKLLVLFRCSPFAYAALLSKAFNVPAGAYSLDIENKGAWYAKPKFIFASGTYIYLTNYDKTIIVNNSQRVDITIDCESQRVYNPSGGHNLPSQGDFFELQPGWSSLAFNCTYATQCQILYRPTYLYSEVN